MQQAHYLALLAVLAVLQLVYSFSFVPSETSAILQTLPTAAGSSEGASSEGASSEESSSEESSPERSSQEQSSSEDSEALYLGRTIRDGNATIELMHPVISGGLSKIYEASYKQNQHADIQWVAVKMFNDEYEDISGSILQGKVNDTNVVPLIKQLTYENHPTLVFDYAYGGDLAFVSRNLPLFHPWIIEYDYNVRETLVAMARGVAACHEKHIYHNNIKLDNFLYFQQQAGQPLRDAVKLTNFYMALEFKDEEIEQICINTDFAPPGFEQHFETMERVFLTLESADVWSLGLAAIELVAGKNLPHELKKEDESEGQAQKRVFTPIIQTSDQSRPKKICEIYDNRLSTEACSLFARVFTKQENRISATQFAQGADEIQHFRANEPRIRVRSYTNTTIPSVTPQGDLSTAGIVCMRARNSTATQNRTSVKTGSGLSNPNVPFKRHWKGVRHDRTCVGCGY